MAIVVAPRCGIERAGCVWNNGGAAWNAEMLPDKTVSEDERR